MYAFTLGLHNVVRWLVVLTGVVALLRLYRGLLGNRPWTLRERVSIAAYAHSMTLQFVIGLVLYLWLSPLGMSALGAEGAMQNVTTRYFALEHPVTMLLALALAHVALVRTRKAATDGSRYRTAVIC
jgi:hypothetical protein